MAKTKISEYDATAANNTDINSINIAEGCAPSGINNAIRETMAALKRFQTGADGDPLTVGGNLVVSGSTSLGAVSTADINGGTIDGTTIGGSTPAAGTFTTLASTGNTTLGDASGDSVTINAATVSTPNGLNFDSNTFVIDAANNRVGIGTSSPAEKLSLSGNLRVDTGYIYFAGNTSTPAVGAGIYRPAADTLGFVINNTERMRINSSGNVLLNNASSLIATNTSDGSDSSVLAISGGGAASTARGGYIELYGNENASAGIVEIASGNVANSYVRIQGRSTTSYVRFDTNATERMRIDSSGNVGIGTSSPASGYNLTLSSSTNNNLVLQRTSTTTTGGLWLFANNASASSVSYAGILGQPSTTTAGSEAGNLLFYTKNAGSIAERMRITSDGYLRMASGSGGIQFNGDTAAANALDDYEEGTWTATVEGSSTAGTASYTVQTMAYVKIGNAVFINGYITYSGATGTGNLRLAGLPFTTNATYYSSLTFALNDIVLTAVNYGLIAQTVLNNTKINFYQGPVGGGSLTAVPMDSAGDIYIGGVYFI